MYDYFEGKRDVVAPELVQLIEELIALCISVGVRDLTVKTCNLHLSNEIPRAVKAGWLEFALVEQLGASK